MLPRQLSSSAAKSTTLPVKTSQHSKWWHSRKGSLNQFFLPIWLAWGSWGTSSRATWKSFRLPTQLIESVWLIIKVLRQLRKVNNWFQMLHCMLVISVLHWDLLKQVYAGPTCYSKSFSIKVTARKLKTCQFLRCVTVITPSFQQANLDLYSMLSSQYSTNCLISSQK